MAECRESGVGAYSEKSWTSNIQIPETHSYPNLSVCGIMNVIFRLKVYEAYNFLFHVNS